MAAKPHIIYQSMMLEIKIRIREIDSKLENAGNSLSALDVEFCFLQARKIVEQICFSSILCDQHRYKDFRLAEGMTSNDDVGDYEKDWNSRVILTKLKNITPHFMPIPLGENTRSNNVNHFKKADVNTTHTKLINIYKKCGSFLHIPKPFGEDYETYINKQRNRYKQATETIHDYSNYFKDLLWCHAAVSLEYSGSPESLEALENANPKTVWLVNFEDYESDNVSIVLAHAN
ncbi:hypothetical protein [Sulfurimonas sp.]|uniref:hypothetical protein n=1 Tax=Sulfurimonas sp. TaxID=2022749 RepID=UPI0035645885